MGYNTGKYKVQYEYTYLNGDSMSVEGYTDSRANAIKIFDDAHQMILSKASEIEHAESVVYETETWGRLRGYSYHQIQD